MENQGDAKSLDAETNQIKEPEKKPDNTNFRKVTKGDESEMFVCNICNWEATEAKRVKQHISKKHRERSIDSDEDDEDPKKLKKDENTILDESMLDKWDKSGLVTSTQVQNAEDLLDMFDESGNPLISDDTREALEKTGDITIKECDMKEGPSEFSEIERQLMTQTKVISNMEEKMKVKDDIILMNQADINSLEMEGIQNKAKMDKFKRIVVNVTGENKKLKEEAKAGTNSEMKGNVKKLNDKLKEKNKKIEESEKRITDLMKKFGEETNLRAKAEAEVIRANKMVDYLHEIIESEKNKAASGDVIAPAEVSRTRYLAKPRCLDQDRLGGCPYGDLCRYTHDEGKEEIKIQKTEDCGFWLDGYCRFTDKACRNIHDQKKKGTRIRQEARRSHGGSLLGQGNPAAQLSMSQAGAAAGGGLPLLTAGGQLYLHQGGQVIQQVQPVLGLQGGQQSVQQGGQIGGLQGVQGPSPQMVQGIQLGVQGGQVNHQQVGLGGWRLQ